MRVGSIVGSDDGTRVGSSDGRYDGASVGWLVGSTVGWAVGNTDGSFVGSRVGFAVGKRVGLRVGDSVGDGVGGRVGYAVGKAVGETCRCRKSRRRCGTDGVKSSLACMWASGVCGRCGWADRRVQSGTPTARRTGGATGTPSEGPTEEPTASSMEDMTGTPTAPSTAGRTGSCMRHIVRFVAVQSAARCMARSILYAVRCVRRIPRCDSGSRRNVNEERAGRHAARRHATCNANFTTTQHWQVKA